MRKGAEGGNRQKRSSDQVSMNPSVHAWFALLVSRRSRTNLVSLPCDILNLHVCMCLFLLCRDGNQSTLD